MGGNTCRVGTSKAFAALSPGLRVCLEGLTATHTWEVSGFRDALAKRGDDALATAIRSYPPVSHRVVLEHPDSGRECLYVNGSFTQCIDGVDRRESRAMLDFLCDRMQRPEFMVHHRWEASGLAVCDNRSTHHCAVADYRPMRRVNRRVSFDAPGTTRTAENVSRRVMAGGAPLR